VPPAAIVPRTAVPSSHAFDSPRRRYRWSPRRHADPEWRQNIGQARCSKHETAGQPRHPKDESVVHALGQPGAAGSASARRRDGASRKCSSAPGNPPIASDNAAWIRCRQRQAENAGPAAPGPPRQQADENCERDDAALVASLARLAVLEIAISSRPPSADRGADQARRRSQVAGGHDPERIR